MNRDIVAAQQPYPTMVAVMEAVDEEADYDFGAEFGAGLEVVLDGIQRWRDETASESELACP